MSRSNNLMREPGTGLAVAAFFRRSSRVFLKGARMTLTKTMVVACCLMSPAPMAIAQVDWPSRPIRVIVASPAGGGVDTVARIVGQFMTRGLKQPVVVDPKPGAGGNLAANAASVNAGVKGSHVAA